MDKSINELSEKIIYPSDLQTKIDNIERNVKDLYIYNENILTGKITRCHNMLRDVDSDIKRLEGLYEGFIKDKDKNTKILNDFLVLIKDYKLVKSVCMAHNNLSKVKLFSDKLNTIEQPLRDNDLEIYHSKVYANEDFMYDLEYYNHGIGREDYIDVSRAINTINKQILEFEGEFLNEVQDFIENWEVLEKIQRIVEKEEKRDELTRQAKEGEKSDTPVLREIYKLNKRYVVRQPKELKKKSINTIRESIKNKFSKLRGDVLFVKKLGFVNEDLIFIKEKIHLDFFTFDDFLKEYHNGLRRLLEDKSSLMDAGEILAVIEFVADYYNNIESNFKKIADALGPRILSNENDLLEKYTLTAEQKLKEWITNITKIELDKFNMRNEAISKDEEDRLISPGFVSLLQIIKMQLEPIAFNKKIFSHITFTIVKYCDNFKNQLIEAMKKDFLPSVQMKSKPGYEDFCIMFGNSGLKLTQYITSLPQCQSPEVRELGNTFISILQASNMYLSKFVLYTCKSVLDKIFTDRWYNEDIIKVVIITLKDFLSDYERTMSDYSFITFLHELSTSISLSYLKQLAKSDTMISQGCTSRLKGDYVKLKQLLEDYGDKDDITKCLSPILKIIPLIESRSSDLFITEVKSLVLIYPDIKRRFVKTIINKRNDLIAEEKKVFTNRLKECFGENLPTERTIFSKLFGL